MRNISLRARNSAAMYPLLRSSHVPEQLSSYVHAPPTSLKLRTSWHSSLGFRVLAHLLHMGEALRASITFFLVFQFAAFAPQYCLPPASTQYTFGQHRDPCWCQYACMNVWYECMYTYVCRYTYVCINVCMQVFMYVCILTYVCILMYHTCVWMIENIYINTYIHI